MSNTCQDLPLPRSRAARTFIARLLSNDLVRKVGETLTTQVLMVGVGVVTSVILARLLGAEKKGLLAVAATVSAILVQVSNLGMHAANTYYVSKNRKLLSPLLGNTLAVSFILGSLVFLGTLVFLHFVPQLAPLPNVLLAMVMVGVPFAIAFQLMQSLLVGINEIRAYNGIGIFNKVFSCVLICGVACLGARSAEVFYAAMLAASLVGFLWAYTALRRRLESRPVPSVSLFRKSMKYGLKAYVAALLALLAMRVDLLMVNNMLGPAEAGIYSIAVGLMSMMYLLPNTVGLILFPRLCEMDSFADRLRIVKKVVLVLGAILVPAVVVLLFVARPLIWLLYGTDFVEAASPLIWLTPGFLILSIESQVRRMFISDGFRIEIIYAWIAALILNVGLNYYVIPRFGIKGAAIASSASFTVLLAVTMYLLWSNLHHLRRVQSCPDIAP